MFDARGRRRLGRVPAHAQLADISIEDPIQEIDATPGAGTLNGRPIAWVGTMRVMGATVRVLTGTVVHTPTNPDFGRDPGAAVTDTAKALRRLDPVNGFGFEIRPDSARAGTLLAVEGYFVGGKLYYHTIEADSGTLVLEAQAEVSIVRAACRFRGRNRDELEVRGGTHTPANARVTIQYLRTANADPTREESWVTVNAQNIAPVVDATVAPAQGLYRYNASNLSLGAVCPAQVRAIAFTRTGPARKRVAVSGSTPPDAR